MLQASGKGDSLALFMVNEDLMEINAQLRILAPRHRIGARRVADGAYHTDRRQYEAWAQGGEDDGSDSHTTELREAVRRGLSLRDIEALTGVDASGVLRAIQRGLRNIGGVLGCREAVLEHAEALDELAYGLYREMEAADDVVPLALRPSAAAAARTGAGWKPIPGRFAGDRPPLEIHCQDRTELVHLRLSSRQGDRRRGATAGGAAGAEAYHGGGQPSGLAAAVTGVGFLPFGGAVRRRGPVVAG